ncbi:MAG: hypothetical protein QME96_08250 [Myxococcota bacterium]|nr:hypothetical protein [Myxococcota bacterium]
MLTFLVPDDAWKGSGAEPDTCLDCFDGAAAKKGLGPVPLLAAWVKGKAVRGVLGETRGESAGGRPPERRSEPPSEHREDSWMRRKRRVAGAP